MPIIASAKKKLKQDKKRHEVNQKVRNQFKKALKEARQNPTQKTVSAAYSAVDTAAKKKVIHKNRAARLKSRLVHKLATTKPATA